MGTLPWSGDERVDNFCGFFVWFFLLFFFLMITTRNEQPFKLSNYQGTTHTQITIFSHSYITHIYAYTYTHIHTYIDTFTQSLDFTLFLLLYWFVARSCILICLYNISFHHHPFPAERAVCLILATNSSPGQVLRLSKQKFKSLK